MEIYVLTAVIWMIGWLYTCGVHSSCKRIIRDKGTDDDREALNKGGIFQYIVLFFAWPHYLGYGR